LQKGLAVMILCPRFLNGDNSDYNHLDPVDFLTSFPLKADDITLWGLS